MLYLLVHSRAFKSDLRVQLISDSGRVSFVQGFQTFEKNLPKACEDAQGAVEKKVNQDILLPHEIVGSLFRAGRMAMLIGSDGVSGPEIKGGV